jgi:hypothetical protein
VSEILDFARDRHRPGTRRDEVGVDRGSRLCVVFPNAVTGKEGIENRLRVRVSRQDPKRGDAQKQ